MTVAATQGRVRLLHYEALSGHGASREANGETGRSPVLFIPSLINAPDVLDMSPDNSLLRFLTAQGHDIYQIDWGTPAEEDRDQDIGRYVTDLLLPLVAALPAPPIMVGYCLGGTIAIAAAALAPCAALATIATPWYFDAYPQSFRDQTHAAWDAAEPACRQLGVMPMEVLQAGFWSLDPRRTIEKYARFADMAADDPGHDSFLLLEDWVNEGAPMTLAAGHDLIRHFYGADIPGTGQWIVGGKTIDAGALPCPTLAISSTRDSIVPHDARPPATERISLDLGHVGMVVGRSAREKLWEPLAAWLLAHGG
ncbi:MAG TPA: alpha/beta hydrolase [Sphingobium sp.]